MNNGKLMNVVVMTVLLLTSIYMNDSTFCHQLLTLMLFRNSKGDVRKNFQDSAFQINNIACNFYR